MKFLVIMFSFFIGFIIFMPKENIFFTLQKELSKQNIYINTQTKNNLFTLNLKNSHIFINGINIANINQTSILTLILFNKINIHNITINFNKLKIKTLYIQYSILNPLKIDINGIANFANIKGDIDLKTNTLKVYLLNLTNNSIKSFLHRDQKGYFYVQKF